MSVFHCIRNPSPFQPISLSVTYIYIRIGRNYPYLKYHEGDLRLYHTTYLTKDTIFRKKRSLLEISQSSIVHDKESSLVLHMNHSLFKLVEVVMILDLRPLHELMFIDQVIHRCVVNVLVRSESFGSRAMASLLTGCLQVVSIQC